MKILVTAGPTREFFDPVRFISNRSSGKMGYAVARAAAARGHRVILVSGPVHLSPPRGVCLVRVTTAADMLKAVRRNLRHCDALVMAAAVADWRPRRTARRKLKKRKTAPRLDLEQTDDILLSVLPGKGTRIFVGFAAETDNVIAEARRKLAKKGLDLIAANDITRPDAGFDVDTNRVTLLARDGTQTALPLMTKDGVARRIVRWIEQAARSYFIRRSRSSL
jgi:phosphopantothenoylcysteine decarboxylase / phosphopantothenate---cysteine ligase